MPRSSIAEGFVKAVVGKKGKAAEELLSKHMYFFEEALIKLCTIMGGSKKANDAFCDIGRLSTDRALQEYHLATIKSDNALGVVNKPFKEHIINGGAEIIMTRAAESRHKVWKGLPFSQDEVNALEAFIDMIFSKEDLIDAAIKQ